MIIGHEQCEVLYFPFYLRSLVEAHHSKSILWINLFRNDLHSFRLSFEQHLSSGLLEGNFLQNVEGELGWWNMELRSCKGLCSVLFNFALCPLLFRCWLAGVHRFKHPQVLLLYWVDFGQQRVVVSGELAEPIITRDHKLYLFHVIHLVHLDSAFVHDVKDTRLVYSWVVAPCVKVFKESIWKVVALFKAQVVGAYQHQA